MHNELRTLLVARAMPSEKDLPYRPVFFRLTTEDARQSCAALLRADASIQVFDTLPVQLPDLLRSQHPSRKLNAAELAAMTQEHLQDCPLEEYGVWVSYPWKKQLVHLIQLNFRNTSNRYKEMMCETQQLQHR